MEKQFMFSASVATNSHFYCREANGPSLKQQKWNAAKAPQSDKQCFGWFKKKELIKKEIVFSSLDKNSEHDAYFGLYGAGKDGFLLSNNADNFIQAGSPFNIPEFPSLHWLQRNLGNLEIPGCNKESNSSFKSIYI